MQKKLVVLLSLICACFVGCGPKTVEEKAEAGSASAQFNLGNMYNDGNGVPEDDKEAFKWLRLAADQGVARAQSNLGFMYEKGHGVPQAHKEAVRWWPLTGR
jgi:TPR repeat protein